MTSKVSIKSTFIAASIVSLVLPLFGMIGFPQTAFAGPRDGRPLGGCLPGYPSTQSATYFNNDCPPVQVDANGDRGYVMPRRFVSGAWRESMYGINTINELMNYLRSNNNSGNNRLRIPAAYIAHSLLGRSGDQANANGRYNISNADWTDIENRLRQPGITINWNENTGARFNTGGRNTGDVIFLDRGNITRNSIVIRYNGSIVYKIQRECANPIGNLGLPSVPPWRIVGSTTKSHSTRYPGQSVTFTYRLRNVTSNPTTRSTNWRADRQNNTASWSNITSGNRGTINPNTTVTVRTENYTIPSNAPEGAEYCRRISWAWTSSSNSSRSYSGRNCVTVVYNYELQPIVDVPQTSMALGDSVDDIDMRVNNTGPTRSNPAAWGLVRFVVPSGNAYSTSGGTTTLASNTNFECQIATRYTAAPANCTSLDRNAAGQTFNPGLTTTVNNFSDTLGGIPLNPGDRVCYAAMVNRWDENRTTANWRYSTLDCVQVGKVPTAHIWGNDLRVGSSSTVAGAKLSGIQGRTVRTGGLTYGSWGEYAAIAPNDITNFGSAAGLSAGNASAAASAWNELTFANTATPYGNFAGTTSLGLLPDVASYVSTLGSSGVTVINTNSVGAWPGGATHAIIQSAGTVTITGNITRPSGAYASVATMPQLIIVADQININDGVGRIDAWLVATNGINTCANGPANLTVTTCDNTLQVNGPIIAERLDLRRTAGSDNVGALDDPAETINMPASTYIWSRYYDEQNGQLKTITTRELPPRY